MTISGAIRADITASDPQQSGSMIVKDKKMYFWNAQKQGFTMPIPEVTPGAPNTKLPTRQFSQQQDMMQQTLPSQDQINSMMQKYKTPPDNGQ